MVIDSAMQNVENLPFKVSVGMPVYNGEKFVARAIESLILQTHSNIEIIISDNFSTDGTELICRAYADKDRRIRYTRQKKNIGGLANFQHVLDAASSDYFAFIAHDDYWAPNFVEKNLTNLISNEESVASICDVAFVKNGQFDHEASGAFYIDGPIATRISKYLKRPSDNSRYYGLFRKSVLKRVFEESPQFHALDWYQMALTLMYGSHSKINEVLLYREMAEPFRYENAVKRDNVGHLWFGFPLLPMTRALIKKLPLRVCVLNMPELLVLNMKMFYCYNFKTIRQFFVS